MKILFTSVGRRVELIEAFRYAVKNNRMFFQIYGADMDVTAPALKYCDHVVIVPPIKSKEYIPTLLKICEDRKIDALIPTIDTDLQILSENKELLKQSGTRVVISSPDKIRICRDKRLTSDYFNSIGLKSPQSVDDYKKYDGGFPAFIKPKDGSSSILAFKANTMEELKVYAEQVPNYIIQPFISGTEYTVDVMCDFEGNPIYITPRIRVAVRAGEVLKTEIRQDKKIIEEVKKLLLDYKPCGAITLQLIRQQETGEDIYIEINPRFGGGAPLSIKAGADSAEALLRLLNGEKLTYQDAAAEDGAIYSRFEQSIKVK